MKTYKDVKARFKAGQAINAVNHVRPESSGRRQVMKVQTNGYWFQRVGVPTPTNFWFAFPAKAAQCRIDDSDTATFLDPDGSPLVTICFAPAEADTSDPIGMAGRYVPRAGQ